MTDKQKSVRDKELIQTINRKLLRRAIEVDKQVPTKYYVVLDQCPDETLVE
ncbi:MAG: hypothetical protein RQ736_08230 [Thiogranum sp.]|nr:hypothetical protein [Thiogranum sp.]